MFVELLLLVLALAFALLMRPWRLMPHGERSGPLLATLVLWPTLWTLPVPLPLAGQLRWSGACLVVLMLGWPVAVPALVGAAAIAWAASASIDVAQAIDLAWWSGVLPATLAMLFGVAARRCVGHHLFVYVLVRAFLGTVVCVFATSMLHRWAQPPAGVDAPWVASWLMAWGDGIVTGMLASIFVAYAPGWLATWSDRRFLYDN
ncbi:MAG: hypothetical protein QM674_23145 [Burkholderiaceae bacterium]